MKLPIVALSPLQQLSEFDVWLTPSFGDIKDSKRFQRELDMVVSLIEAIGGANNGFEKEASCRPSVISETFIELIRDKPEAEALRLLQGFAAILFLVSGKSDNNVKCQLPVYLFRKGVSTLPRAKRDRDTNAVTGFTDRATPRTLKASDYMVMVASLYTQPDLQGRLLEDFVRFVLNRKDYVTQMWTIGRSFYLMKALNRERELLTPLVIFQVRGSVSASGGHGPEGLLRALLKEWGLQPGVDFNLSDVVPADMAGPAQLVERIPGLDESLDAALSPIIEDGDAADDQDDEKKRGYDFVLPYETPGWLPRIFIQCQFYAGDSGSVSHKNVDQTKASRQKVEAIIPDAEFIEYVDGAGYFSSLNGDLKKLLKMANTKTFIQVRSAPIRLRRELQTLGFLTPLELEHAIFRSTGRLDVVTDILREEGYADTEIGRVLDDCRSRKLVRATEATLEINPGRRQLSRRYFLLDTIAREGSEVESIDQMTGGIFVPGYGRFRGLKLDDTARRALELAPSLRKDWSDGPTILSDIRWICEKGWALSR